jgi:Holliday junction resolvasome RuvABC endonuclease subunit
MLSLGLDPSLSGFGWCVHNPVEKGKNRVVIKGRISSPSNEVFIARYMGLRDRIIRLINTYPDVQIIGVESPPFGELWSEGLYGLFLYVNEAIFLSKKDVVFFDPSTVKLLAKEDPNVRTGKMFKSDMVAMAKADTGVKRWNSDEADAYIIARFAARFYLLLNKQITDDVLLPSERHVFLRSHTFLRGKFSGETKKFGTIYRENERFFRFSQLPKSEWLLSTEFNSKKEIK